MLKIRGVLGMRLVELIMVTEENQSICHVKLYGVGGTGVFYSDKAGGEQSGCFKALFGQRLHLLTN